MLSFSTFVSALAYPVGALLTTTVLWQGVATALVLWGRRQHAERTADVIVVPGCPARPDGTASPALARRVEAAVDLYRRGRAPRVCVSGHRGEATAGMAHARSLGLPDEAMVAETQARTTAGNALHVARILPACSVIVVSDDYHLLRCALLFGRHIEDVQVHSAGSSRHRMALREVGGLLKLLVRDADATTTPAGRP